MNKLFITLAVMVAFAAHSLSAAGKPQERSDAGVAVKVSLESEGAKITVEVALNTHTVDLGRYKFDEIVTIRSAGKEYKPRLLSQTGAGHHRSAVLEFDNPETRDVQVVIRDVAGVKERVFKFSR